MTLLTVLLLAAAMTLDQAKALHLQAQKSNDAKAYEAAAAAYEALIAEGASDEARFEARQNLADAYFFLKRYTAAADVYATIIEEPTEAPGRKRKPPHLAFGNFMIDSSLRAYEAKPSREQAQKFLAHCDAYKRLWPKEKAARDCDAKLSELRGMGSL